MKATIKYLPKGGSGDVDDMLHLEFGEYTHIRFHFGPGQFIDVQLSDRKTPSLQLRGTDPLSINPEVTNVIRIGLEPRQ